MNFKDALEDDLSNVFLNSVEFAETANINGKDMDVVIDDHELERQKSTKGERLTKAELLFHVSQSVLGNVPKPDALLDFNKKRYRIFDVSQSMGLLTITLGKFSG